MFQYQMARMFRLWCSCLGCRRTLFRLPIIKQLRRTHPKCKTTVAFILTIIIVTLLGILDCRSEEFHFIRYTNRTSRNSKEYSIQRYRFSDEALVMWDRQPVKLKLGLDVQLTIPNRKLLNDPKFKEKNLLDRKFFAQDQTVKAVNCRAIFNGDMNETKRASNKSASQPREKPLSPVDYTKLTSNCKTFIAKRGYVMSALTQAEAEFPIAFSVLMFKDPEQAERLLRAIYRPQNIYCIHVDKKANNDTFRAMEGIANCFDNVFMARTRIDVQWGKFSVLEPDLICMEELLKRNKKWKYFINLTGQEFPLRTNHELVRILKAYNGANDIEGTIKHANKDRWSKLSAPPHNLTAIKGSVKITANRDFVDFAVHNQKAHDVLEWSKGAANPDECFFTMLNHNPSLRVRGAYLGKPETDQTKQKPFLTRFVNWETGMYTWPCHGQRVRSVCIFGVGDLPLLSTRRELFANKFYLDYERYALDCMEEWHFNRTRDEFLGKSNFDTRFYEELGFVKNKIG